MKLNRKNKALLIAAVAALLIFPAYKLCSLLFRAEAPDPGRMAQKDAVKYLGTKEFSALPESEQERYMKSLQAGKAGPTAAFVNGLSQNEHEAVFKNTIKLMQKEMKERLKAFFAMSREDQDKFLDNMAKSGRFPAGGPPIPGGQGGPGKAMLQNILENTDSTTRAQMTEFFSRMEQRMKHPR